MMRPLDCAGAQWCIATDLSSRGSILTSLDPASGWEKTSFARIGITPLAAVTCPAPSRCYAVDREGRVLASDDWHIEADLSDGWMTAIDCPTVDFCVAGDQLGALYVRDGGWRRSRDGGTPGATITSITCASRTFCVASDSSGRALKWDGAGWSVSSITNTVVLDVTCPTTAFCAALDHDGAVLVSTDGASTWSAPRAIAPEKGRIYALACPSAGLCVAGGLDGAFVTLGDGSWRKVAMTGWIVDVDCPSVSLCAVVDYSGHVFMSTDPAGGVSAWHAGPLAPGRGAGVACAGGGDLRCELIDEDGNAWSAKVAGIPFNVGAPTVGGTALTGDPVRCSPGEWTPAPTAVGYQWEWGDETIPGATGETYTPASAGSCAAA